MLNVLPNTDEVSYDGDFVKMNLKRSTLKKLI